MMSEQMTARHLQRLACLSVRQSTLQQVLENTERTARQYALRERAVALGWSPERSIVIDQALGHSGASAADRAGFQRLVAEVGLGQVGLVLGLEVSRLARSSSDWHRLLESCALTGTLIRDEDGLYDPATCNDRLLLGLKGPMREAALDVLRARLPGGMLSNARRAALTRHWPVGFCDAEEDRMILDPDRQVQDTIRFLFRTFQRTGSAAATVRAFRRDPVPFPRRVRSGPPQGALVGGDLQPHEVRRILHHPCDAGACAVGRTRPSKTVDGKIHLASLPREPWHVVVHQAHAGSLAWEAYERPLTPLAAHRQAYTPQRLHPPREGPSLLQGLVLCGRCGERMTGRDHPRGGRRMVPDSRCQRAGIARGEPPCQRVPGRARERALANVLVEVVTPETVALTLAVQDELVARAAEAARLRQLQVERAQSEAALAQRRSRRVAPENRLVADGLATAWHAKRRAVAEVREAAEPQPLQDQTRLRAAERETMLDLPRDVPRVWRDPRTTARERKRVVRLLIEDVTVQQGDPILAQIRFKGGATRALTVPLPPPFTQSRLTPPDTLAAIDQWLDTSMDGEVAAQLNARGYRPCAGLPFQGRPVSQLRRAHGLKDRLTRLREAGMRTAAEVAARLGVSEPTIWRWYRRGWMTGARDHDRGPYVFVPPETVPRRRRRQCVRTLQRP